MTVIPTSLLTDLSGVGGAGHIGTGGILVSTYRRNQAVVGFSAAMVRAGALATTYSSVDEIAEQLAEILDAYLATGRLRNPQFPRYWRTTINESVARSLDIVVDETTKRLSHSPASSQ